MQVQKMSVLVLIAPQHSRKMKNSLYTLLALKSMESDVQESRG